MRSLRSNLLVALVLSGLALANCGGDDDDDSGGASSDPTASIAGRVASLETAESSDAPVADIQTSVSAAGTSQSTTTDAIGDFSFGDAPSGNVALTFVEGSCTRSFDVLAVADESFLTIGAVRLDCRPGGTLSSLEAIGETFRGVVRSITSSGVNQVNVQLCTSVRGAPVARLVRGVSTISPSFDDFAVGDLVEVDGNRDFADFPTSDLDSANEIRIVARNQIDECG